MLEKVYGTAGNDFSKPFGQLFSCGGVWRTRGFRMGNAGKEGFGNLLPNRLSMEIGVQYYGVSETEEYVEAGARRCKGSTFAVRLSSVLPRKKENTDIFAGIQNKMCNFVSDI